MKAKSFIKKNGSKILIGAALFAAGAVTTYICGTRIGFNGYCHEDVKIFKNALRNMSVTGGKLYACPRANAKISDLGIIGNELTELFDHAKPDRAIDAIFITTKNK